MPAFTLADLRAKAYSRVDNNDQLYTLPEIDYVINEALRVVGLFTCFYRQRVLVPAGTVANQLIYPCPPGIFVPLQVHLGGRQLQRISFAKLVRLRRTWATDTTFSRGKCEFWAPIGNTMFVLSPAESIAGRTLLVTGRAEPPLLVNPDDVISLENEYVEIIAEYCDHRLPLKEGGKVFADGSMALKDFYARMKERKSLESMKTPRYWLLEPSQDKAAATAENAQ